MNIEAVEITEEHTIADFLAPISADNKVGVSLKEDPIYAEIQEARASDDPSLPRGVWEHDLKKSNWDKVNRLSQNVLLSKSKDIQVAMWFLESQIHLYGIGRLAPGLLMISEIVSTYWDEAYPRMENGDIEYRTNLFAWMTDKLSLAIRQLIIADSISGNTYSWVDWERAVLEKDIEEGSAKNVSVSTIKQAIDQTHIDFYKEIWSHLADSNEALDILRDVLEEKLGEDAPSLLSLGELLRSVHETIYEIAGGRALDAAESIEVAADSESDIAKSDHNLEPGELIPDRHTAYAFLAEAAAYLMRDDPHSPVPHLVYKAIDWGRLSTSELYEEIFIRHKGNLNIFDVLGIDADSGDTK